MSYTHVLYLSMRNFTKKNAFCGIVLLYYFPLCALGYSNNNKGNESWLFLRIAFVLHAIYVIFVCIWIHHVRVIALWKCSRGIVETHNHALQLITTHTHRKREREKDGVDWMNEWEIVWLYGNQFILCQSIFSVSIFPFYVAYMQACISRHPIQSRYDGISKELLYIACNLSAEYFKQWF